MRQMMLYLHLVDIIYTIINCIFILLYLCWSCIRPLPLSKRLMFVYLLSDVRVLIVLSVVCLLNC